jgi:hypothetical protein
MASSSFRNSMNSLGWSRREADLPASTNTTTPILSKLSSLNPFGRDSYVQLPSHEPPGAPLPAPSRREEDEGWFACECPLLPHISSLNSLVSIITMARDQVIVAVHKIRKQKQIILAKAPAELS